MSQNTNFIQGSGLTPNAFPTNQRVIIDANFVQTIALNSGAGNAVTNAIDLGDQVSGVPYVTTETINVGLLTSFSNNGNSNNTAAIIGYLQHTSANTDGTPNAAAWVLIPTIAAVNVASLNSNTTASSFTYKLPPGTKRFIRALLFNNSSASLADSTATLELLF